MADAAAAAGAAAGRTAVAVHSLHRHLVTSRPPYLDLSKNRRPASTAVAAVVEILDVAEGCGADRSTWG